MINRFFFELLYFLRKARWDSGISPPELIEHLNVSSPGKALDLGCGTGTNAITMAQLGWDVVGIDISTRAIKAARRKAKSAGLDIVFVQGDVIKLNGIKGPFDLVLDIGCFHILTYRSQKRYIANLQQILHPDGTFLLYTHLDKESVDDAPLTAEDKIREFFQECCDCVNVVTGSDTASHHRSGWFTMKRTP